MPLLELVTSSGLGSLLGMRHALEPDHIAAVSTLVTSERNSYKAALLGACWGLGHTFTLIAVGAGFVILRAEMPARVSDAFEFCVALMLIGLGLRAIYLAARQGPAGTVHAHHHGRVAHVHQGAPAHIHIGAWTLARRPLLVGLGIRAIVLAVRQGTIGPAHTHHHGDVVHRHAGATPHVHVGRWTLARRPLLVGAVHGLAGSGALTALVLATLTSTAARITYMTLFGFGSTLGMAILSGLLGWPLAKLGANRTMTRALSVAVGCLSIGLGIVWGYPLTSRLLSN